MVKTQKKVMKPILICGLIILSAYLLPFNHNPAKTVFLIPEKEYTIEEKHEILEDLGKQLKSEHGLKISPSKFADFALIVLYCESGLNTKATSKDGHGSQGINQLTLATRKSLGLPKNIVEDDFPKQVEYFKEFLIRSNKISKIRSNIDLHLINFAPNAIHKELICEAKGGLTHLDLNQNGHIDREDFVLFHKKRAKDNKYIWRVFKKYYPNA